MGVPVWPGEGARRADRNWRGDKPRGRRAAKTKAASASKNPRGGAAPATGPIAQAGSRPSAERASRIRCPPAASAGQPGPGSGHCESSRPRSGQAPADALPDARLVTSHGPRAGRAAENGPRENNAEVSNPGITPRDQYECAIRRYAPYSCLTTFVVWRCILDDLSGVFCGLAADGRRSLGGRRSSPGRSGQDSD